MKDLVLAIGLSILIVYLLFVSSDKIGALYGVNGQFTIVTAGYEQCPESLKKQFEE